MKHTPFLLAFLNIAADASNEEHVVVVVSHSARAVRPDKVEFHILLEGENGEEAQSKRFSPNSLI